MVRKNIFSSLVLALLIGGGVCSCNGSFDPSDLQQQIDELDRRISALEDKVEKLDSYISSVNSIVYSIRHSLYVISVQENSDGFYLVFSDGSHALLPKEAGLGMGVIEIDGEYWWTLNGALLLDSTGSKVPVSDTAPVMGITEIDGKWYWTLGGEPIQDGNGRPVEAQVDRPAQGGATGNISSIAVKDGVLTVTLADGTTMILPMSQAAEMRIEANKLHFSHSQTISVHVALEGIAGATITEKPDGWRAELNGCTLSITAPADGGNAQEDGHVVVLATSGIVTLIGKVYVTTEAPLFSMSVIPTGDMSLTELDSDFTNPGFWAGFTEADSFDPAAIVEPAKEYTPQSGEGFYDTKLIHNIKDYIKNPVPGKRYAAYCFPGSYSRRIGINPNPDNVFVKYFTYVENRMEVTDVTTDSAELSVSLGGVDSFYGGIILCHDESDDQLRDEFLADAMAPIQGTGDGMYGSLIQSYRGSLNLFAAPKDGDGKPNARTIIPGAEYAIALVPQDGLRVFSEYSVDDVILCKLKLNEPVTASETLVSVKPSASTTTSASADFNISANTVKFFYRVVKEADLAESGLNEYTYALFNGIKWDREIIGAKGSVICSDELTGLNPGEKCRAIGLAFNENGEYQLVSKELSSSEVLLSSGSLAITGVSTRSINANSTEFTFQLSFSDNIESVRYIDRLTKEEFENYWNGEDEAYSTLTAGRAWEYETINPRTNELQMYLYPENVDYILFAVGVDNEGKFTELAKYEFNALD